MIDLGRMEEFVKEFIDYNGLNDFYWIKPEDVQGRDIDLQHEQNKRTALKIFLTMKLAAILDEWTAEVDGYEMDFNDKYKCQECRKYLIEQLPDFPYVMGYWS